MKKPRRRPRSASSSDARLDLLDAMTRRCQHLLTVAQLLAEAEHARAGGGSLAARTGTLLYQEAEKLEATLLRFRRAFPPSP